MMNHNISLYYQHHIGGKHLKDYTMKLVIKDMTKTWTSSDVDSTTPRWLKMFKTGLEGVKDVCDERHYLNMLLSCIIYNPVDLWT